MKEIKEEADDDNEDKDQEEAPKKEDEKLTVETLVDKEAKKRTKDTQKLGEKANAFANVVS